MSLWQLLFTSLIKKRWWLMQRCDADVFISGVWALPGDLRYGHLDMVAGLITWTEVKSGTPVCAVHECIYQSQDQGWSLADILIRPVHTVLDSIATQWSGDAVAVLVEHRGTRPPTPLTEGTRCKGRRLVRAVSTVIDAVTLQVAVDPELRISTSKY